MGMGLELRGVSVVVGGRTLLDAVDLEVARGGVHALIGASGAGKTTLLRTVAGLTPSSAGSVAHAGRVFSDPEERVPAEARRLGFVFQGHGLWPHLDVRGHLAFTLDCMGVRGSEASARIARTLDATGLVGMESRRPDTLSGGERQRLGLARAVVGEPELLLLDEPTASLDPTTAASIRACLLELNRERGTTLLLVTHDQREAFALAGTVSVMDGGRILRSGTPAALWKAPGDAVVAAFLGSVVLVPGTASTDGCAETSLGRIALHVPATATSVRVVVRPSDVVVDDGGVDGVVQHVAFREGTYRASVRMRDGISLFVDLATAPALGSVLRIRVPGPCPVVVESTG